MYDHPFNSFLEHSSATVGSVAHCVLDVLGLVLEGGMFWAHGTTESNPGEAVAIEAFCHVDSLVSHK